MEQRGGDVFFLKPKVNFYQKLLDLREQIKLLKDVDVRDALLEKYNDEEIELKTGAKLKLVKKIFADFNATYRKLTTGVSDASGEDDSEEEEEAEAEPEPKFPPVVPAKNDDNGVKDDSDISTTTTTPKPTTTTTTTNTAKQMDRLIELMAEREVANEIVVGQLIDTVHGMGLDLTTEQLERINATREKALAMGRENKNMKEDITRLQQRVLVAEAEAAQCPTRGACTKYAAELEVTIKEQDLRIEALQRDIARQEEGHQAAQKRLEEVVQRAENQVKLDRELLVITQEERDRARRDIDDLKKNLATVTENAKSIAREADQRAASFTVEVESLRKDLEKSRRAREDEGGETVARIVALETEKSNLAQVVRVLEAERTEMIRRIDEYAAGDAVKETLRLELESTTKKNQSLLSELEELRVQKERREVELQKRLDEVTNSLVRAETLIQEQQNEVNRLEQGYSARGTRETVLENQILEARDRAAQLETKNRELEKLVSEEREKDRNLSIRIVELQQEVALEQAKSTEWQQKFLQQQTRPVINTSDSSSTADGGGGGGGGSDVDDAINAALEISRITIENRDTQLRELQSALELIPLVRGVGKGDFAIVDDGSATLASLIGDGSAVRPGTYSVMRRNQEEKAIVDYVNRLLATVKQLNSAMEEQVQRQNQQRRELPDVKQEDMGVRLGYPLGLAEIVARVQYTRMAHISEESGSGTHSASLTFSDTTAPLGSAKVLALRTGAMTPQIQYASAKPELVANLNPQGASRRLQYDHVSPLGRGLIPAEGSLSLELFNSGRLVSAFTEQYSLSPPSGVTSPYGAESEVVFSDGTRLYASYVTSTVYSVKLIVLPW